MGKIMGFVITEAVTICATAFVVLLLCEDRPTDQWGNQAGPLWRG